LSAFSYREAFANLGRLKESKAEISPGECLFRPIGRCSAEEVTMLADRKMASRFVLAASAISLALLFTAGSAASTPTPFDVLKGSWRGDGSLKLQDGKRETLGCTAYYRSSGGGDMLGVALRCAGKTTKFELRSYLDYKGGSVSGSWEERTFNASGDASGVLKPGSMRLNFRGGVSGNMSVAFTSSSQSISISIASAGAAVTGIHLKLHRR
jgi:hypothetical protein